MKCLKSATLLLTPRTKSHSLKSLICYMVAAVYHDMRYLEKVECCRYLRTDVMTAQ